MTPNWKRTLLLAVLLVGLGGGAYWLEYKHKPKQEAAEEGSKKPLSLEGKTVAKVILANGADHTYTLKCQAKDADKCKPSQDAKWEMETPMVSMADSANSNSLLASFNNLQTNDKISLKDDAPDQRAKLLKDYGLSPEDLAKPTALRIEVQFTDGGKRTLRLGGTHPIGGKFFSLLEVDGKVDTSEVWLIPSYIKNNLDHDLTYWRDKKLFTLELASIDGFKLQSAKSSFAGVKKDGQWTLHALGSKDELPGDLENVEVLLSSVSFLTAKGFPSSSELKGAKEEVTVTLTGKEPLKVSLLSKGKEKDKKAYAKVEGREDSYEVDPSALTRIQKSLKDVRLTRLLPSMERFAAKTIQFTGVPEGTLSLTNKDGKWFLGKEASEEANGERVQKFLDDLSSPKIKDFVTLTAAKFDPKMGIDAMIGDEKDPAKRKFHFWTMGTKFYARDLLSKRAEAFEIDMAIIHDFPWIKDHFKKQASAPPEAPHK